MRWVRKFFGSSAYGYRLSLTILSASAGIWAVKLFCLDLLPEAFPGAAKLGQIVESLCANLIAASVFFVIVSLRLEGRSQAILRPYIKKHSDRLVGDATALLTELSRASGVQLNFENVTQQELSSALASINVATTHPNLVMGSLTQRANWIQYFDYQRRRSQGTVRRLLIQARFLEPHHIRLITEIDETSFFRMVELYVNLPSGHFSNLQCVSDTIFEYILAARSLDQYGQAEFS